MTLGALPKRKSDKRDLSGLRGPVIDVIKNYSSNAPRSLQKHIGPSQVGTPCNRQLAYQMSGIDESRSFADPWPSIVGTATHAWLAEAFEADNQRLVSEGQPIRWYVERRVDVGFGLTGSCDVFDALTGTVIDHKILGNTSYTKYVKEGPSQVYRTQAHCYGLGYIRAGFEVKRVAINFFGRAKTLQDLHVWSEDFDMTIALRALDRMRKTQELLDNGVHPSSIPPSPGESCYFCSFRSCTDDPDGYCKTGISS